MNEYMKTAKELAENNLVTNEGGPFGACVVKDGVIVGKGANKVLGDNDPTAHAEIVAIRDACRNINSYDLTDCELYTTCYPCPMCLSAIIWSNIKMVYYGNSKEDAEIIGFRDNFIYDYLNNQSTNNLITFKCIDREETIKAFKEYVKKINNDIY